MCAYCPKVFIKKADVRDHTKQHRRLDVLECPAVRNSIPLKVDVTDLICIICKSKSSDLDHLKKHLSQKHDKCVDVNYSDGIIPFKLTDKEYRCLNCGELFKVFMNLSNHMNKHYQSYICDFCGKAFAARHRLRAHKMIHENGNFPCSKCELVFPNRVVKNRHLATVHGTKDRYRCPQCDLSFVNYGSRLRHLEKLHGEKVKYTCLLCPSIFANCNLRTAHVKMVHTGVYRRKKHLSDKQFA